MTVPGLRVGSRDSQLALAQAEHVIAALKQTHPALTIELKTFKTQGDLRLDVPLAAIGDKGLFVKELEVALLEGAIDVAIHSMKDMPGTLPEVLQLTSICKREAPEDAFVSVQYASFDDLPAGSVVGTASVRRVAQLTRLRPDLQYVTARGNLNTRMRKLEDGEFDALILAAAGLRRLGWHNRIRHTFAPGLDNIPAVCQGILGAEYRQNDARTQMLIDSLMDEQTQVASQAERAVLETLEGGCKTPMGAYAYHIEANRYQLNAVLMNLDGSQCLHATRIFMAQDATSAGTAAAEEILAKGGSAIRDAL